MKEVVITSKVVGREGVGVPAKIGQGTTVDLSAYLLKAIWDKVWEIRTDSTGKEYIFGKLPVVTQYGITMYAGDGGDIDLPSLYAGLPIDNTTIYWENGVLKAAGSSGGGGVADSIAWANVYGKPSWITDTKPAYSYNEIQGVPDLSVYATNKALEALGLIVDKKADKSYVDGNFVTLTTDQDITGLKTFVNGLYVGNNKIYQSQDDVIYLDGNLVVRGGITMYGTDSVEGTSIMESLLLDSSTLKLNEKGELTVVGGSGGLNITELQNYLTQNSYLNVTEGDGRYLKLSGGTLTGGIDTPVNQYYESGGHYAINLNNSDIIGANAIYFNDSANTAGEGLIFLRTNNDNYDTLNVLDGEIYLSVNRTPVASGETAPSTTSGYKVWHSGNSTPTDAKRLISIYGTASSNDTNNRPTSANTYWTDKSMRYFLATASMTEGKPPTDAMVIQTAWDNTGWNAQLALSADKNGGLYFRNQTSATWRNWKTILDSNNYSSYALSLSGGAMAGDIKLGLNPNSVTSTTYAILFKSTNNNKYLYAKADDLYYGVDDKITGKVLTSLNIGSHNAGSATKLQTARTIWGQSFDGTGNITGQLNITTGTNIALTPGTGSLTIGSMSGVHIAIDANDIQAKANGTTASTLYLNDYGGNVVMCGSGGNVGIGTTNPAYKLDVKGIIRSSERVYTPYVFLNPNDVGIYLTYNTISWHNESNAYATGLMTFTSSGNVGVGVSPVYKFHVKTSTNNAVRIEQNHSNSWAAFLDAYNTGLTAGQHNNINFGYQGSKYNSAWVGYYHAGVGSTSNRLSMGLHSVDDVLNITASANVGIGTTAPSYKLHVVGNTYLNGDVYVDELNTYDIIPRATESYSCGYSGSRWYQVYSYIGNFSGKITATGGLVGNYWGINDTSSNPYLWLVHGGYNWYIQAYNNSYIYLGRGINYSLRIDTSGNVLTPGGITMYSDQRKKTILRDVELSLKEVANAPLIEHYYNSDDKKTTHVGSIAQYWAGLNDWFCKLDSEGYYTMEIQNAALASAISVARELDRYETKTDKQIKKLKKRICELEEEVERLKAN